MGQLVDPNQIGPVGTDGAGVPDGTYGLSVESGIVQGLSVIPSGGGGGGALSVAFRRRITDAGPFNTTTPVAVDTALDMALTAKAGDRVALTLGAKGTAGSSWAAFDFMTMVSGAFHRSVVHAAAYGTPTTSLPGWGASTGSGSAVYVGTHFYTVDASDVVSGIVTFRLTVRCGGSFTIEGNDPVLTVGAVNYGS